MLSDERLSRLLDTLAQVAISVELQPTLQILLDSLHTIVPFDAGGIFVRQAEGQVVRARAARGGIRAIWKCPCQKVLSGRSSDPDGHGSSVMSGVIRRTWRCARRLPLS